MIIGLTGGIASGKSTVVEIIKDAGYKVIDADQLVHDMQVKGGRLYQALLDWLGDGILLPNGELNRPKLGQLIFSSEEMRYQSAEIQGKIIREELEPENEGWNRIQNSHTECLYQAVTLCLPPKFGFLQSGWRLQPLP